LIDENKCKTNLYTKYFLCQALLEEKAAAAAKEKAAAEAAAKVSQFPQAYLYIT
jgi:hypothetical protein